MNKIRFGLKALVAIAVISAILFAAPSIGRFVPTHKIEQPVYCGSCHPEQVEELSETTHLGGFAKDVVEATNNAGGTITAADAVSKSCQMCHNYWENFKWWGVRNLDVDVIEVDDPSGYYIDQVGEEPNKATDIYGNDVSPYGLGSTKSYIVNVTAVSTVRYHSGQKEVEPWTAGLDVYQFTDASGVKHSRIDYLWSQLSALSPGPVGYRIINITDPTKKEGCGTAEKGMCHIAVGAVTSSKKELPEYANGTNTTLGGTGIFFTHEMAFTTAQYAAKPVKICGACHVFKLPPMRWGGEPWAELDVRSASTNSAEPGAPEYSTDPFGFGPNYNDLVGDALVNADTHSTPAYKVFRVAYRTPDWAHANVPCIRCHAHAGIQGSTVSDNAPYGSATEGEPLTNDRPMIP